MLEMVAKTALGVVLVALGVVMLVLPGPGLVVIAIGVGLILSQFGTGRRWLARLRVALRERFGSPRVRQFEARMPREVFPPADTDQLRVDAVRRRVAEQGGDDEHRAAG